MKLQISSPRKSHDLVRNFRGRGREREREKDRERGNTKERGREKEKGCSINIKKYSKIKAVQSQQDEKKKVGPQKNQGHRERERIK